jgi:replicative DNA helicase
MSTPELVPYEMLAKEILRRCFAEEDATMMRQWLQEQLARMGGGVGDDAVMTWQESFDYYEDVLIRREQDAALPAAERRMLNWPWQSWNNIIDPLEPGLLAVISAPDGTGKTILAESIAEHWARNKNRIVFVHYELNRALMMDRRTARHTSITRRELKSGQLTVEQKHRIADMRPRLLSWDGEITYLHTPGWSMERTVEQLRKLRAEGKCDGVVLDYLEKNAASRRQIQMYGNSSYQREADNVEQIKNFAESTETPVLMLTQFSKAGKSTDFSDMDRTDIRGAGEKTEKANVVVLMHREKEGNGYSNLVNVKVDKNTVGATGSFKQMMQPEFFRLGDVEEVPLTAPEYRWNGADA